MRRLLVVVVFGLTACSAAPQRPGPDIAEWRTSTGERLTSAEFDALRQSCEPRIRTVAIDPDAAALSPAMTNPAYHPGGEGLMSTTPTGIAGPESRVAVTTTKVERGTGLPPETCLESKGLVMVP